MLSSSKTLKFKKESLSVGGRRAPKNKDKNPPGTERPLKKSHVITNRDDLFVVFTALKYKGTWIAFVV